MSTRRGPVRVMTPEMWAGHQALYGRDRQALTPLKVDAQKDAPAQKPRVNCELPLYPLVGMCRAAHLPEPVPEASFHPGRRWRFDYSWPLHKLALEVEGGIWTQGRHTRGQGAIDDLEKYSEAAILGWRIIYATPDEVRDGVAMDRIERALRA